MKNILDFNAWRLNEGSSRTLVIWSDSPDNKTVFPSGHYIAIGENSIDAIKMAKLAAKKTFVRAFDVKEAMDEAHVEGLKPSTKFVAFWNQAGDSNSFPDDWNFVEGSSKAEVAEAVKKDIENTVTEESDKEEALESTVYIDIEKADFDEDEEVIPVEHADSAEETASQKLIDDFLAANPGITDEAADKADFDSKIDVIRKFKESDKHLGDTNAWVNFLNIFWDNNSNFV